MKSPLLSAALAAVVLPLAVQATTHEVAALSDLAGVNKALRVKAGDTVSLPVLSEGSYKVTNARYASLGQDGATLTILEPGMLGQCFLRVDLVVHDHAVRIHLIEKLADTHPAEGLHRLPRSRILQVSVHQHRLDPVLVADLQPQVEIDLVVTFSSFRRPDAVTDVATMRP